MMPRSDFNVSEIHIFLISLHVFFIKNSPFLLFLTNGLLLYDIIIKMIFWEVIIVGKWIC